MTPNEHVRQNEGGRGQEDVAPTESNTTQPHVFDGEMLTDVQSEYVDRWLDYSKAQRAVQRRQPTGLARHRVELVRRRAGLARRHAALAVVAVWRADGVARTRSVLGYRVRKAPVDVLRLAWFVIRGHGRWLAKAWTFFTYGDLRADARAARVAGDPEARRKAQELIRADSRARWARLAMATENLRRVAVAIGVATLALWLIDSMMSRAEMWPWLARLYEMLATVWGVATATGPILAAAMAAGWAVAAAYEGRDLAPGAGFLVRPDRADPDSWIDERMISQALAHLGISPMDRFFKNGGELVYTVPARLDGDGTYAQVRLPMGVTADMVADRRDRLAANLGRAKLETWPTEGSEAGQLELWVADKGALGRGAGPWPLLVADGQVDVFEGVPFGRSQRGHLLHAPIMERNYIIGGRPGQGKTSAGRTLCLGCALDPTVELRAYVFATNPDFDPFTPRLSRYVKGDEDEAITAGVDELRALREDVTRRGRLLERHGASKVTRKLASTVTGLHPKVVIFDECHELFEHPLHGSEAASLAIKVVKKARKCGITLIFLTQSPTATSIPKDLTRNCSNGVAFSVADQVANDGLLGTGKYRQGIRATELRPGDDRGTAVTVGLTANRFELVNTFYVPFDEDRDEMTPVITRAMALLEEHGLTVPAGQAELDDEDEAAADHLADIHEVTRGETRVRTQLVLRRLADLNPDEYEGWSFQDLAEALARHGLGARKYNGTMVVRSAEVARALTLRDEDEDDGDA
jgi:DNA segregation ATPase FtsK/SpoIIIE, S-DNA-T family